MSKERRLTLPNLITLLRIFLIPLFLSYVWEGEFTKSLLVFFIASITDGLDGLVARRFNQTSKWGQVLDPAADKLLLTTTYLVLTFPNPSYTPIPIWLTVGILLRDLGIVLGALFIKLSTGFSDFKPSVPGKWNTTVLVTTVLAFLIAHATRSYTQYLMLFYLGAFAMTLFSGLHYIYFVKRELDDYRAKKEL